MFAINLGDILTFAHLTLKNICSKEAVTFAHSFSPLGFSFSLVVVVVGTTGPSPLKENLHRVPFTSSAAAEQIAYPHFLEGVSFSPLSFSWLFPPAWLLFTQLSSVA